ncbi:MAG: transposase [Verrucomicrobia bacterium]|nr:transposase [Verrucomicrobiota bacterium]MDA1067044.1 transposase [Verrucomicrobiota bacterium]
MARKPRIQYRGALYHVISRGNYRKDLFTIGKTGEQFEKAIFEVCARWGWKLHAYVIMSNHYHLALETPLGNLVEGMRWLQGTFGNRFNKFTGEQGHVFQGRYKALLVEPGRSLLGLVNYIHLNPVRAKLLGVDQLKQFSLSSYPKLFKRSVMPPLVRGGFLSECNLPDNLSGIRQYEKLLHLQEEGDPRKKTEMQKKYLRGWAIATEDYKKELHKDFKKMEAAKDWGGRELRELNELTHETLVSKWIRKHRKTEQQVSQDKKSATWKIELAKELRSKTSASNPWIARRLNMGDPSNVSRHVNSTPNIKG